MNPFRYDVSFRVRHPKMASEEICKILGMTARHQWTAGTERRTPKGAPLEGVYDSTYCSFRLDHPQDMGLAEFLGRCNKTLAPNKEFLKRLRLSGGALEYFIGWYSRTDSGELFSYGLLRELADLEIDLAFDVYAGEPAETAETDRTRHE